MAAKISIIVPVYGVEKYLSACIESILSQTYDNFEIILVDDKSPDKCGDIADEYAKKDARVKVVHKTKNEGLNMARATGFEVSTGDFITFIDSDDKIAPTYVSKLLRAQQFGDADVSMCGLAPYDYKLKQRLPDYNPNLNHEIKSKPDTYTKQQIIYFFLTQFDHWPHNNNLTNTPCKLIKRAILNSVDWKSCNYSIGEDDFEAIYVFSKAEKYAVINDPLYLYRIHPDSISNSRKITPKYNGSIISIFELCGDFQRRARKYFGEEFENEINYRTYTLFKYYVGILIKKKSLVLKDVAAFDEEFPLDDIMKIKRHTIDNNELKAIKDGGVAGYLIFLLNLERDRIRDLERQISSKDAETTLLNEEISSFLGIKRSFRLLIGNIKRKLMR